MGYVRLAGDTACDTGGPAGPERRVYATTAAGRAALAQALERDDWTTGRERPAFLTWLALSWQADARTVRRQIERRRAFLERELAREEATLRSVLSEVGHPYHEAVWMIRLMIDEFRVELRWLRRLARELPRRGRARHPEYAPGGAKE
jgi:hypothetical protein